MSGFFKETELREFSFEDKLRWCLRTIVNSCNPHEIRKERGKLYYYEYSDKYHYYSFVVNNFHKPKVLPESEFNDLKFWIDENNICFIELQDAKYEFHLSMLLRVQLGLIKAIGKK